MKAGMKEKLEKEPDNMFDKEAIMVKVKGMGKCGYVANSPYTVKGESMSAGRIYDRLGQTAKAKMEKYLYYGQNVDRSYVKCPYCNNTSFRNVHCCCEDDKTENLSIQIDDKRIKLGNSVMMIRHNGKIFYVNDFVYHLIMEHPYVPRKWFEKIILHGGE